MLFIDLIHSFIIFCFCVDGKALRASCVVIPKLHTDRNDILTQTSQGEYSLIFIIGHFLQIIPIFIAL